MPFAPAFPTGLHREAAQCISDYFVRIPHVDTVLLVNSCARGQAVPESDLDLAILVKPGTTTAQRQSMERQWLIYSRNQSTLLEFKSAGPFSSVHLDVIDGHFFPAVWDDGGGPDYFEVEIGNRIVYSVPMSDSGAYLQALRKKWLPYYSEELRLKRLAMAKEACAYDADHVPFFVRRGLYFQAFDRLYKAFSEFLQTLFIARKTYPVAYNKWIKEQLVTWLDMPDLYRQLPPILSITNLESDEMNGKAKRLFILLEEITAE
jgi:hypothetical protein